MPRSKLASSWAPTGYFDQLREEGTVDFGLLITTLKILKIEPTAFLAEALELEANLAKVRENEELNDILGDEPGAEEDRQAPGNRDPEPQETAACRGFLERQIELVQPRVIVALGRVASLDPARWYEACLSVRRGRSMATIHDEGEMT